jgi:glutamyl-tRNA reductase
MGQTVARLLGGHGTAVQVMGRNAAKAQQVASEVGGLSRTLADLTASLSEADVVVTSTSAPHYVVTKELVSGVRRSRRGRSLFFIDLAVPRDVDPRVAELDGIFLYNIDDFSRIVAESLASREREYEAAEGIITRAAAGYERWAEGEHVTPVIKALRSRFSEVMHAELQRSLRGRLKDLEPQERDAIKKMLEAALNKMLHEPSSALRAIASDRARDAEGSVDAAVELLTSLFSLELSPSSTASEPPAQAGLQSPESEETVGPESGSHQRGISQEDAASSSSR